MTAEVIAKAIASPIIVRNQKLSLEELQKPASTDDNPRQHGHF